MTWTELKTKWQKDGRGLYLRSTTARLDGDTTRVVTISVANPLEQNMEVSVTGVDPMPDVIVAACNLTDAELTALYPS